ncbi:Alpha/Beta hydrolase protein [Leptodontidium sp. 2 PMI_412]|nr:Alpha/Beta hydrolase protein [Leptodontidium sp. 2 PMI_412]
MPRLITKPYKTLPNGTPILADIYTTCDFDIGPRDNNPIVLFFHAGGLTAFNRKFLYPSLVQAILKREWTLVSVDYRLLPQASPEDLWDDVKDAYRFVVDDLPGVLDMSSASRGKEASRKIRRVVVAGASAGTYLAFLAARYFDQLSPPPVAIMTYYGIPSFNHAFFKSNTIIYGDEKMPKEKFAALFDDTNVSTGYTAPSQRFDVACLNADLSPNTLYVKPTAGEVDEEPSDEFPRPDLYDYYLQENTYPELFKELEGKLDFGSEGRDWKKFPKCVLLHGTKDVDGPLELSQAFVDEVGDKNARLVSVEGAGHMLDDGKWLDDEGVEMNGIKEAWALVDRALDGSW